MLSLNMCDEGRALSQSEGREERNRKQRGNEKSKRWRGQEYEVGRGEKSRHGGRVERREECAERRHEV